MFLDAQKPEKVPNIFLELTLFRKSAKLNSTERRVFPVFRSTVKERSANMPKTTVLVKFPGQSPCFMEVPTNRIERISESIAGLQRANVEMCSLYRGFYFILMDKNRKKLDLPHNVTAYLMDKTGETTVVDVSGTLVICKLPKGLMNPLSDMTQADAEQVVKLLRQ